MVGVTRGFAVALFLGPVLGVVMLVPIASGSVPSCAKSVRVMAVWPPAPVKVSTPCAVYTVFSSGRVVAARRPRLPNGITWMAIAGPSALVVQRGDRIAVLRGGREIWRSTGRFRAAGVFATLGVRSVAFSYERYQQGRSSEDLYVAQLDGRERELASDERPLGWTLGGSLLTWRFRQGFLGLYLRRADGTLLARVGARLRELRFDPASRTVLAFSRSGVLERYDGHWRRLADLRALGFGRHSSFEPLAGGLIGVLEGTRVLVLRPDGAPFASARFHPRRKPYSVAGQSGLVANTAGSAVAFAVTSGDSGSGGIGRESLYVLQAGDRSARPVYSGPVEFAICERWASLSWHGDWLLYAATEGKTLVLDSRDPTRRIDLTSVVQRLASIDAEGKVNAQVAWASNEPARAAGRTIVVVETTAATTRGSSRA
jgi:hypothetical protein